MSDLILPGDNKPERVSGEVLDGEVVYLSIRETPGSRDVWECYDLKSGRPVGWASRRIRAIRGRRDEVELATKALCAHEGFVYKQPIELLRP